MGNGPSLKEADFQMLQDEYTFGSNRIYLSGFRPTYYVCVNPLVLEQYQAEIASLSTTKFIPKGTDFYHSTGQVAYLDTRERRPGFYSPAGMIWEGHTVTYVALQLAHYMGFEETILLGVDHDYGTDYRMPNQELRAEGEDRAHFHPGYFSDGVKWNAPDLARSEIAYSLARRAYEQSGRDIINCSARTKLRVFPVMPLNHIDNRTCRVSALVSAYYSTQFIEQCLTDLRKQSEVVDIVVVCKRGSEEERIARGRANKVITTEDVPPLATAWNLAAREARGRYLTTANTDDRFAPDALGLMADILDAQDKIDLVYGDDYVTWEPNTTYTQFRQQGAVEAQGRVKGKRGIYRWPDYDRELLGRGCFIGPHPLYRANLHQTHGPFDESYKSAADYEFWLRCAGDRNYLHLPFTVGVYLAREDSLEQINREVGAYEAWKIQHGYAAGNLKITPEADELRIAMGNEWSFFMKEDFKRLGEHL